MKDTTNYLQLFYIALAIANLVFNASILYVLNETFKKYKLFENEGVEYKKP